MIITGRMAKRTRSNMATISKLGQSSGKRRVAEVFNSEIMLECDEVFVCGQDAAGELRWDASGMRGADLLWVLEKIKHELLFGD